MQAMIYVNVTTTVRQKKKKPTKMTDLNIFPTSVQAISCSLSAVICNVITRPGSLHSAATHKIDRGSDWNEIHEMQSV
jgi:hypothetical protein